MYERLNQRIIEYFSAEEFVSPVDWIPSNIRMDKDISARSSVIDMNLTPYLRDPLEAWNFIGRKREVTIVAIEQTGKSAAWVWGLIWSFKFIPCMSIVCYPSDDLAAEANSEKLNPLMRSVPSIKSQLDLPNSKTKDHYFLSNSISYFMGSGSRVTSKSARIRIGDELDDWILPGNINDLRKRARSFDDGLFFKVCSPTTENGLIWQEFLTSSQGYWHLRCQNCGELSIRSCDIFRLQFETEEVDGRSKCIAGSERLVCPKCKHSHAENLRRDMILGGDYIHKFPEKLDIHPGYQWGALASQWSDFDWENIANAQLLAGRSGNIRDQQYFDNSIRGLPFKQRAITSDQEAQLAKHETHDIPFDDMEILLMSIDTQDYGWKWEVRGFDIHSNRYLVDFGFCESLQLSEKERKTINDKRRAEAEISESPSGFTEVVTIEDVLSRQYHGIPVALGIIDEGGHRKIEVARFVEETAKLYAYKGDSYGRDKYRFSENQDKLILAHKRDYQSDLLYYLYTQNNKDNNYWYLLPDMPAEYYAELAAFKPDNKKRDGHYYENWDHGGRVHDYFDTSCMYLTLEEVAIDCLELSYFKHLKAEIIGYNNDSKPVENEKAKNTQSWLNKYNTMGG